MKPYEPIVKKVDEERGISGPDICVVTLRNGWTLEIGDEGVNAYRAPETLAAGKEPNHSISFYP